MHEDGRQVTDQVNIDTRVAEGSTTVAGHDTLGTDDNRVLSNQVDSKVRVHLYTIHNE